MQFSFDRKPQEQESSSAQNDRLKKAIERNRSKMTKRQSRSGEQRASSANTQASAQSTQRPSMEGSARRAPSMAEKLRAASASRPSSNQAPPPVSDQAKKASISQRLRGSQTQAPPQARAQAEQSEESSFMQKMRQRKAAATAGQPARKNLTTADNIEIATPAKRKPSAAASRVDYSDAETLPAKSSSGVRAKRKVKTKNKTTIGWSAWAVKGTWVFCAFLLLRLIFSEGGVIEYYDKKAVLEQKQYDLKMFKQDNENLMVELENIRSNARYQKKLVRDHLGYIAKDEYLVLFPKNKNERNLGSI